MLSDYVYSGLHLFWHPLFGKVINTLASVMHYIHNNCISLMFVAHLARFPCYRIVLKSKYTKIWIFVIHRLHLCE